MVNEEASDVVSSATPGRGVASLVGGAVSLVGAVAVVVGAALPWVQTGRVRRSAFTVVRVANDLGVFEGRLQKSAVLVLLITPAVTSLGLLLHSVGRRRSASACLAAVGVVGCGAGAVALRASSGPRSGPMVSLIGGLLAVLGALLVVGASFRNPTTADDDLTDRRPQQGERGEP